VAALPTLAGGAATNKTQEPAVSTGSPGAEITEVGKEETGWIAWDEENIVEDLLEEWEEDSEEEVVKRTEKELREGEVDPKAKKRKEPGKIAAQKKRNDGWEKKEEMGPPPQYVNQAHWTKQYETLVSKVTR
jgi:hypothetical protein